MAASHSIIYMCTRALHSFISRLLKATSTPFIQPNHGLPRTRPTLTSAINTLLAILYSSILCSTLLSCSLSIPALSIPIIRDILNTLFKHFISSTFTFLLSAFPILHSSTPYNAVLQSLLHIDPYSNLSPILYCPAHFSAPHLYLSFILCATSPFTSSTSIRCCHLRSQVLKTIQRFVI